MAVSGWDQPQKGAAECATSVYERFTSYYCSRLFWLKGILVLETSSKQGKRPQFPSLLLCALTLHGRKHGISCEIECSPILARMRYWVSQETFGVCNTQRQATSAPTWSRVLAAPAVVAKRNVITDALGAVWAATYRCCIIHHSWREVEDAHLLESVLQGHNIYNTWQFTAALLFTLIAVVAVVKRKTLFCLNFSTFHLRGRLFKRL